MGLLNKLGFGKEEEEEEEQSNYPYRFLVVKWRDNAQQKAVKSWRAKKLVYIEGGKVKWQKGYFPGREKIRGQAMNVPYYDETGGQSAPEIPEQARAEPGVIEFE